MKNYNTKKKITIAVLAVVAVFLAGGLWVYMDSMKNKEPAVFAGDDITQAQDDVSAPEIKIPASSAPDTPPAGTGQQETSRPGAHGNTQPSSGVTGEQSKPSDGKPKTPDEATPPATPTPEEKEIHEPSITADPKTPPSSTPAPAKPESNTPKSGDKNDKGEIYVPGFGWIPDQGGGVEVEEAPNAGTGEKVGDM